MPHVILRGKISIDRFNREFKPLLEETGEWLIKAEEIYVEQAGLRAIIPATVVEEGHSQSFYIRISTTEKNNRLTVRLDPATDPIKTRGVKRSIGLIGEAVLNSLTEASVERHNLQEYFRPVQKGVVSEAEK